MIRVVVIECLLSFLLGAIIFRLTYGFLSQRRWTWLVTLITAAIFGVLVSGRIDPHLRHDFATHLPEIQSIPPWLIQTLRASVYLWGAWLSATIIKKREKIGYTDQPPDP